MWKLVVLYLSLWEYSYAGPLGIKKNMPIVQGKDDNDDSTSRGTKIASAEEKPASDLIISKLNLPSNATSIRAEITDGFSCDNKTYGYYADVDNECQIFHVCLPVVYADGKENTFRWSFICPEETIFSQDSFTCMRAEDMNINCDESYMYYDLNRNFGTIDDSSLDPTTNNENDEEVRMENRQPEVVSETKPESIIIQETPIKVQANPNRKKNSNQKRKPTQPPRRAATTARAAEEIGNEAEFKSTTSKIVPSTYSKTTKRPPTATITNIQTQKKDQRPYAYNPIRKRPQVQQTLRDAIVDKAVSESPQTEDKIPLYPVQVQPEPQPTLKIETFFKPQTPSYYPAVNVNNEDNKSQKPSNFDIDEDDHIQVKDQHGHLVQASEIKEVTIKPSTQSKFEETVNHETVSEHHVNKESSTVKYNDMLQNQESVMIPIPTDIAFLNPEMSIPQFNENVEKFPLPESEYKDESETEIPLSFNQQNEPLGEESLNSFVTAKPEPMVEPAEISVPAEIPMDLAEYSPVLEELKQLEKSETETNGSLSIGQPVQMINADEISNPQQENDIVSMTSNSEQNQLLESSLNAQEMKPESAQIEADSAQALIADFISTLVNAENAKLKEKPTIPYESPMVDAMIPADEIKKETFPEPTNAMPALSNNNEDENKLTPSLDMFQIPVQIIHTPVEEQLNMKLQSTSIGDEQNNAIILADKKKNDGGVFIPLSVDDVVELVKDRLVQNQSVETGNVIQASDSHEPQSSEILPIYHRLPEVSSHLMNINSSIVNKPTLVAIVNQDASNQQTEIKLNQETEEKKRNKIEIEELKSTDMDKETDNSTTEKQRVVLRRNVKIHNTKMDPRKRRFLFRSHSS